jgi:hypothetical protein
MAERRLALCPTISFAEFARAMRRRGIDERYLVKRFLPTLAAGQERCERSFSRFLTRATATC